MRVRPGERVALDGVIVDGRSSVNQAPITGESLPVDKAWAIRSLPVPSTSRARSSSRSAPPRAIPLWPALSMPWRKPRAAARPFQRFVDNFARVYTPAVFLAATLIALIPPLFLGGAWLDWIYTALVILVIGCPCALSSPPRSPCRAACRRHPHGLLIKGGAFLELGRKLQWWPWTRPAR